MAINLITFWDELWPLLLFLYLIGVSILLGYKLARGVKIEEDEPEYEHKFFIFRYRDCKASENELNELEHEGWRIESFAGEDDFRVFFILKREKPQTNE